MQNLTLDLETLAVESFTTIDAPTEPEWTTTACC
jgi:hypothetical protein